MKNLIIIIICFLNNFAWRFCYFDDNIDTSCVGKPFRNVTLAAYFVSLDAEDSSLNTDYRGKKLKSLQEYLDDQSDYVTLAMDEKLNVPYGTKVCVPEINKHFGHKVNFQVRDIGTNLLGMGFSRADVFVRTETDSYDNTVNRKVTLVFERNF